MKFSIVTATFNSRSSIADAIASVAAQTHGDIEHIIVDGNSTDGTLDIINARPNRVRQIICEPDQGIYDALNKGIGAATGDIVGFVHSDDVLAAHDVVAAIAEVFESSGADGVYGDLDYVAREDVGKVIRRWRSRPFAAGLLRRGWMPPHPTLYLKRQVYERHGLFDDSLRIAADYDMVLRVMSDPALRFVYLPKLLVKMRVGGASNRSLANLLSKSREDLLALRRNKVGGLGALALKNLSKVPQWF